MSRANCRFSPPDFMAPPPFAHPFRALSLSFKHAPLAVREQLALDEMGCRQLLRTLRQDLELTDLLVLSTCQRTEVYYAAEQDCSAAIAQALERVKNGAVPAGWQSHFKASPTAEAAAQHLFEVALGLDARVVGDWQVISQVKQAYQWAVAAGAVGPFLHRLLHAVFAAHKRVQAETCFRSGAASAGYAALELVEELTTHLVRPRVLVVGAGRLGADVCRHLAASKAFGGVMLCNRTPGRAEALAAACNVDVVEFKDLTRAVQEADVVISAINAPQPVFTSELVSGAMGSACKLFVDLSMPRSVAPGVGQVPGVALYNIDAIESKTSAALQQRLAAVPRVRAIVAESLAEMQTWSQVLRVTPLISQLKSNLEHLRQQELQRHRKRLSPAEAALLDAATRSLVQKILQQQVLHLKAASQRDAGELLKQLRPILAFERPIAA
jgi:glutamyl-tRNA reductase